MSTVRLAYVTVPSPVGPLRLAADGLGLSGVYYDPHRGEALAGPDQDRDDDPLLATAAAQLAAYFAGSRRDFDVPLNPQGTDFQRRVWSALGAVGFGRTVSYAEVARRIGSPRAVRAVGAAVGRNPLSILIPCHRVIGTDGTLTGYAGGLPRKRWLLEHEGVVPPRLPSEGAGAR